MHGSLALIAELGAQRQEEIRREAAHARLVKQAHGLWRRFAR